MSLGMAVGSDKSERKSARRPNLRDSTHQLGLCLNLNAVNTARQQTGSQDNPGIDCSNDGYRRHLSPFDSSARRKPRTRGRTINRNG
jgi:hypothetical protein